MARVPKTFRARFELPTEDEAKEPAMIEKTEPTEKMTDAEPMTEEELASLIDGQINDAKDYGVSELTALREKALKYFEGDISMDVPSAPGRSSVVSRDVADIHGLIMPGLMRVFLATDNVAIYNPTSPSDEEFAKQATDYINYIVMKECGGYTQFRSAFHDGLLMGNGPVKHWWDDTPEYSTESFSGLSDDAYTMLVMDSEIEVLEHTEYDDPDWVPPLQMMGALAAPPAASMMGGPLPQVIGQQPSNPIEMAVARATAAGPGPMMGRASPTPPTGAPPMGGPPSMMGGAGPMMSGAMQAPKLHDCKLKRVVSKGRLRLAAMAPEDLLLGRGSLVLDEENIRFVAHRWRKTRSALIKEGFDPEIVDELPTYTLGLGTPERLARERQQLFGDSENAPDKSTDLIEGYECYVQCDYDGDGIAEWRKVNVAGDLGKRKLLENEEWGDDLPFSDLVPDPVPHRWRGRSLFDNMEDIQRVKSVLMRQTLDNIYMNNTPRQFVLENGVVNPEALQDYEIGTTVFERTPNSVRYDTTPFVADKTFPIMEYLDQVVEKRTGMSRTSMALDMEALSEQTATAVRANQAVAHTKIEEYARNIAEYGGLKRVFTKILKLIVKHQDRARTIRLRDKWVNIDPRAWNAMMDVTINTGIGSGSREHDLTMLMGIATKQEQVIQVLGPTNPVLGVDKLFDTYRLMVEAAGLKPADRFFPPIPPQVLQQMQQMASQKVDPKVQAEQARAQVEAQKIQMQAQIDAQAQQNNAQLELAKMKLQAETDAQIQQAKVQLDLAVAQNKQQLDAAKAQHDAQIQQMQFERQAQVEERQAQADIAVKKADAQVKNYLQQAQFAQDQMKAQAQFDFDKKLKLLDAYLKCKGCGTTGEDGQPSGDVDFVTILNSLQIGQQTAPGLGDDGATHLSTLQDTIDQLTQNHANNAQEIAALRADISNTQGIATLLANVSKPRRVLRDKNNRVIGSEIVPDNETLH